MIDTQGELAKSLPTIEHQQNLDTKMKNMYPEITGLDGCKLLENDEFVFASINVGSIPSVLRKFIKVSLRKSSDPKSPAPVFCDHADKGHTTFEEAINILVEDINEISIGWQVFREKGDFRFSRLKVLTKSKERKVSRPNPYKEAFDLSKRYKFLENPGEKKARQEMIRKKLRKIMGNKNKGILYGLWVGTYLQVPVDELLKIYKNVDDDQIPGRWLTKSESEDKNFLWELKKALLVENKNQNYHIRYEWGAYQKALELIEGKLGEFEWFKSSKKERDYLLRMVSFNKVVRAKAILSGADEQAQDLADEKYYDPARTEYIDREYGNQVTSRVVTAYLVSEKPLLNW